MINKIHLDVVIQCPYDGMAGQIAGRAAAAHTAAATPHTTQTQLGVGLGQHPVHVQDLDAGVHAARRAQLAVRAEGAGATVALVTRHVGRLVGGRLRRL